MVLCSVIKAGWRRETGNFWAMAFHFLSHHYMWMSTSFLQMPVHRKWWINSLFCVACICVFCFTYWAVYIRIHEFCHIYSANSLPHPTGMKCLEWANDRVVFSCWIGLNNYIIWTQPCAFCFTLICHILVPPPFICSYLWRWSGIWFRGPGSKTDLAPCLQSCLSVYQKISHVNLRPDVISICILIKFSGGYWFLCRKTHSN